MDPAGPLRTSAPLAGGAETSREVTPPRRANGEDAGGFAALLREVGASLDGGDALLARAARGPAVTDAGSLIALQIGVYRHAEVVELVAKTVEGATAATRTVMQAS
jgi:hypothetical protein